MALTDIEGASKGTKTLGKGAGKAITKPAAPVMASTPVIDDATAYQLFGPGGASTQYAPGGGVINYALGADPNGYYWVDDGTPDGYWYRPADGKTWRANAVTKAVDAAGVFTGATPVTNAPVVKGPKLKAHDIEAVIKPKAAQPGVTDTPFKLPGAVTLDSEAGGFVGDIPNKPDIGSYVVHGATPQGVPGITEGLVAPVMADDLVWAPPNPDSIFAQEQEGYWRRRGDVTPSALNLKPRAGDGGLGLLADLTGSGVSDKRAQQVAGWITPGASLPGPVGDFIQDTGANLIQNVTSPLGVAGFAFGGLAGNIGGEVGAAVGQTAAESSGLPAWASIPAALVGGVGGGLGAGLRRSVDDAVPPPSALAPSPGAAPTPSVRTQIADILSPEGTVRPEVGPSIVSPAERQLDSILRPRAPEPVAPRIDPVEPIPPAAAVPPPRARTLPTGAAVASTKTPVGDVALSIKAKKGNAILDAVVTVDGADAGRIVRASTSDKFQAFYRNPNGALVPVVKNAAGDAFTGTRKQAENAVANAYNAGGRVLEDVPVKPRAPKPVAAVADEAVPAPAVAAAGDADITPVPSTAPASPVQAIEEPFSELEMRLAASVINAKSGVKMTSLDPAPKKLPPVRVRDTRTGAVYRVNPADVGKRKGPNSNITVYDLNTGQPVSVKVPRSRLEAVDQSTIPIDELSTADIARELEIRRPGSRPEAAVQDKRTLLAQALDRARTEDAADAVVNSPVVKVMADEVAARLPKDTAIEGSPANVRAEDAAIGRATPEAQALHEAEVRGIHAEIAAPTPQPPGPMLGLIDEAAATNAKGAEVRVRTRGERAKNAALSIATGPITGMRNLFLTGDMLVGRQLKSVLLTAPDVGIRGYRDQWRFLLSPGARRQMWNAVEEYRAAHPHMDAILFKNGDAASMGEELYVGNWFRNIPGLKQIEQANALALNAARISLDQKFARAAAKAGVETPESMIARANMIGVLTGRGHGEWLDANARWLNQTLFISSRWTASRFQFWGLLLPPPVARSAIGRKAGIGAGEWYLWRQAAARIAIGTGLSATVYGLLGQLPGVQIETNPLSSKFGSFKWRDRWYDFMGGLEEPFRLFARMWEGEGMSERGSRFSLEVPGMGPVSSRVSALTQYVEGRMPPFARLLAQQAGYVDPFKEAELPGPLPDWARRYIPLSAQQMTIMWNDVMNGDASAFWALFDSVAIFHGESVNDPSEMAQWENELASNNEFARLLDKPEFKIHDDEKLTPDNISRAGWEYIKNNPDIFGAKPTSVMREFAETAEKAANMRAGVRSLQEDDDAKFESGEMAADKWRTGRRARRAALGASLEALYGEFPAADPNSDDVVERYFAAIEANKVGNDIDWEAVEDWEGRLSAAERKELNAYFDEKAKQGTEVEQQYTAAQNTLDGATIKYGGGEYGFFDLKNAVFDQWKVGTPFEQYGSYDEWRQAEFAKLYDAALAETGSPSVAGEKARTEFSNLEGSSGFRDAYKNGALYNWVAANPEAAKVAEEWGYYKPDDEAKAIIREGDVSQAQASQAKYEVEGKVKAHGGDWEADGWRAWASENLPAGADYGSSSEYKSAAVTERVKAREAELGRALTPDEKGAIEAEVSDTYARYSSTTTANAAASVRYVGSDGKWTTGRLSASGLNQVQAAKRIYDADPVAARNAWILGIPPFSSLSQAERAWLSQNGVVLE